MSGAFLVDTNVWLALLDEDHVHHANSKPWIRSVAPEQALLCRVVQLSLLRLLTNSPAMRGSPRSPVQAWGAVGVLLPDERVVDSPEPSGLLKVMRANLGERNSDPRQFVDGRLSGRIRGGGRIHISDVRWADWQALYGRGASSRLRTWEDGIAP